MKLNTKIVNGATKDYARPENARRVSVGRLIHIGFQEDLPAQWLLLSPFFTYQSIRLPAMQQEFNKGFKHSARNYVRK
jgi:hypothetical protein